LWSTGPLEALVSADGLLKKGEGPVHSYRSILAIFGLILFSVILAFGIGLTVKRFRSDSNIMASVGVVSPTQTPTPTPTPTPTSNSTTVTIYVAPDGLPGNKGSATSPIDLATALSSSGPVRPGYTVQLSAGIYRYSSATFAPAGTSALNMTVFKAAPGARVIITSPTDTPPNIYMNDYMRLDGLWFGGTRQTSDLTGIYTGANPISHWKQIVNCTIWGYYGAIKASNTEYALFQGNRFVHNGGGTLYHDLYVSSNEPFPGPPGTATQHNIVDNNIFVAGEGYAIHFWHNNHTNIVTRNFVGQHTMGLVHDGSDALIANNFFWRTTAESVWLPGTHMYFANNIMGIQTYSAGSDTSNTLTTNAFATTPFGSSGIRLTPGQEVTQLGISAASIDNAIAMLDTAFDESVNAIYENTTIESAFSILRMTIPSASPVYHSGAPWAGISPVNLGPDSPVPTTVDAFWSAFRSLGLKQYDSSGNIIP